MAKTQVTCQGCSNAASDFQCPLCNAEGHESQGYFCSQECFATNWLEHRNTCHKSGVVREKKKAAPDAEAAATGGKKRSRAAAKAEESDGAESEEEEERGQVYVPWPPMPSARALPKSAALVTPALPLECPRAVVGAAPGDAPSESFWPHLVAAAHYVSRSLEHSAALKVLVVAGDVRSAHAFAWAARSTGLSGLMRLVVNAGQVAVAPDALFTPQRRVLVATHGVVKTVGGADACASGAAGLWLKDPAASLLVALPDVEEAGDLQSIGTRAVLFVPQEGAPAAEKETPKKRARRSSSGPAADEGPEAVTHTAMAGAELEKLLPEQTSFTACGVPFMWQPMPNLNSVVEDSSDEDDEDADDGDEKPSRSGEKEAEEEEEEEEVDGEIFSVTRQQCISDKLDNDVSTCLANGDVAGAVQHLTRVYSSDPGYYEEVLFNAVSCDWGAASVAHAHHRLAYLARRLVDASDAFEAKKGGSMADATLRAFTRTVRLLPPLMAAEGGADADAGADVSAQDRRNYFNHFNGAVLNLQLQATLLHLFRRASPTTLDTLAAAWGLAQYVEGGDGLAGVSAARRAMVDRVRSRYTAKLDKSYAAFLVILAHLLYDAVAVYSLTLEEVARRLLWGLTLAHDVGTLDSFLANCHLLHEAGRPAKAKKGAALSSRQTSAAAVAAQKLEERRVHVVRAAKASDYARLPWKNFPVSGQRERFVARMHQTALEEVLMAMPRTPKPMYIGDVGNLIGKWFSFNARHGGVLGVSLSDFLSKHPADFQLAGTLVTRRKAGTTEQVRIRFDQDDDGGADSDDDGRRKKGSAKGGIELPARARKKQAIKAFNRERHNRNYKPIDPSARVPGYIKRGPRRITGRGKKPNKRLVKRG